MSDKPKRTPAPRLLKYGWALALSASVGALALSEQKGAWLPVLNGLIDLLQEQQRSGNPTIRTVPADLWKGNPGKEP